MLGYSNLIDRVSKDQKAAAARGKEELSAKAAELVVKLIEEKPACNLALPSGRTPVLMYQNIVRLTAQRGLDWSRVNCFALDDYVDASPEHSFQAFLSDNLYSQVGLSDKQMHNPTQVDDYDALIQAYGGLDLAILGIGANGHIAFNEPGTPGTSFTHSTWLEETTRKALQASFGGIERTPTRGVTMGIATILSARSIILLAFGDEKREILHKALDDGIGPGVPASYLKLHNQLTVLTDCH